MTNLDNILKSKRHYLTICLVKAVVFPVAMYGCELDHKESWGPKNWCFWTMVLEKTLEGPLDCKEIQPVNSKGNESWIFLGRTDAKAETPILWPPDLNEKGTTEDEMVDGIINSMYLSLSKILEMVKDRKAWCASVHGVTKSWTQLWLNSNKIQPLRR